MQRQLDRVVNNKTSLEVPGSELDDDIEHVDHITDEVRDEPDCVETALKLGKCFAGDARPQVVGPRYVRTCTLQSFG